MAQVSRDDEKNIVTFKIEDPSGFQTFQQGLSDRRQWNRHPETRELQNICTTNTKHSQVVIQYNDTYIPLRQLNNPREEY
jgi:hypothetical protein